MITIRNLLRFPSARVALTILAAIAILATFGERLAPHDPLQQFDKALDGPSAEHLLGTDYVGRDVLSRLMAGTQVSVFGALEAVAVGLVLGVSTGLLSVWMGRASEWIALRVTDTLMSLPFTVFAIAVVGSLGNGLQQAMLAIGVLMVPAFFRITRAVALGLRSAQYVEAAELMGASQVWVLRTHIWSKVLPNVAVTAAQTMGAAMLAVAALAFLGLGVIPPDPTWGGVLSADLAFLEQQPWAPLYPGLLLMLTVGSLNILADGITEATGIQRRRRRGRIGRTFGRRDPGKVDPGEALFDTEFDPYLDVDPDTEPAPDDPGGPRHAAATT
jgi:peptide/nickel transport system permease protein